jgi:hypothetical protein
VLDFCLTKVVHGYVLGDTKGVETDISYVSFKIGGVRKEGEGIGFLGCADGGSGTSYYK